MGLAFPLTRLMSSPHSGAARAADATNTTATLERSPRSVSPTTVVHAARLEDGLLSADLDGAAIPLRLEHFRLHIPVHVNRMIQLDVTAHFAQLVPDRTHDAWEDALEGPCATFTQPGLPWAPFYKTAAEEAEGFPGWPTPPDDAIFARMMTLDYPAERIRNCGRSVVEVMDAMGDPLFDDLRVIARPKALDRAVRVITPQRLYSHPGVAGQGLGSALLTQGLAAVAVTRHDCVMVSACPIPSIWGPKGRDGAPAPVTTDYEAQDRLARYYERHGFERIPSTQTALFPALQPKPSTTLMKWGA